MEEYFRADEIKAEGVSLAKIAYALQDYIKIDE